MSNADSDVERDFSVTKAERLETPSGWLDLCKHESVHFIIDALVSVDPRKEFTKSELADFAGVSAQSVRRHIDTLVDLGVVAETAGGKRYHFDIESETGQLIAELNGALVARRERNGTTED